jgi:hypothetical protein
MWNKNLAMVIIALTLSISLNVFVSYHYLSAKVNQSGNISDNLTSPIFTPINNMSTGTSSNTTGIMQNTSGVIDDAFGALKDTFGSFFGK